jgi:hypothetical protein
MLNEGWGNGFPTVWKMKKRTHEATKPDEATWLKSNTPSALPASPLVATSHEEQAKRLRP